MDINKFNRLLKGLGKYISTRLDSKGNKDAFKRDLKSILSSIYNLESGLIYVDYKTISGAGLDSERITPMIDSFFMDNGLKHKIENNREVKHIYMENKMKSNKITNIIREELKKVIKEESKNRYVVTAQFYVWGNNEGSAKKEAEQIIQTIEHKYDNSPQVTDIVSQQFGKLGSTPIKQEQKMAEAITITRTKYYKELQQIVEQCLFEFGINLKPMQLKELQARILEYINVAMN